MPITKPDVLAVLDDPNLTKLSFIVGNITVNHKGYRTVADYIREEDIQVLPGKEPVAFYDGRRNTLIMQSERNLRGCRGAGQE